MEGYNYFASPRNSDRAKRFREAYGRANIGQNFDFEGQPYAGPSAPPGGWTNGINPLELAAKNQMQEVAPSDGGMSPPPPDINSDYYAQNYFREFPVGLDGNPVYGATPGMPSPSEGKGAMFDLEGNLIPPNSGGTSLPFDHPSIAGTRIPFPEQSADQLAMTLDRVDDRDNSVPRFPGRHLSADLPYSVTGMSGPGQDTGPPPGLLADDMSGPRWTDFGKLREGSRTPMRDYFQEKDWRSHSPEELHKRRMAGLLGDASDTNQSTNKSGWEKDKKFSNTQNLLMELGMNMYNDKSDPFGSEW